VVFYRLFGTVRTATQLSGWEILLKNFLSTSVRRCLSDDGDDDDDDDAHIINFDVERAISA